MSQEIDRAKRYDVDRVEEGLTYMIAHHGSARKASRAMEKDGLEPIAPSVLHYWKTVSHRERYDYLRAQEAPRRDADFIERYGGIIGLGLDVQRSALERLADNVDEIPVKDLSKTFKDVSIGTGVDLDKSQLLQNKPTEIVRHGPDVMELERALAAIEEWARANAASIETTGVPLDPPSLDPPLAEVVEDHGEPEGPPVQRYGTEGNGSAIPDESAD